MSTFVQVSEQLRSHEIIFFFLADDKLIIGLDGRLKINAAVSYLATLRAFSPAYKGEGDLQSSGCVAFL